ncbi:GNAT family N-acetyltransferase [Vibrio parahaemolyticus]|uniref:GNAT family N-acetyltransferase n=1 Tax=Vibrio parahaemolyticus TaxID=670 RepID=UPI00215B850C|nr:GNAT family N-acetyltransferase [Vibrio parahaemolyticus]EHR0759553.1 GNAT family N-acetyltransferase [Vibrio parahaemolyticus]EHR0827336.1 GNAT family N-acetyltransferase [Vibrio parahaemolyticus]EHR1156539.1 GNAT family N-acetyltransferase [Vibrio parahaemolyticus]EHR5010085.1 GNAT family N-acetyltransferase [Vibrio parahaemolyticus]MCR9837932.1 GNAT family N-acetyltransferase [Vibrio parahaemolyticus]
MMKVRKAVLDDLPYLVHFTSEEAREAEGSIKIPETLEKGILVALRDPSIATYWVLVDKNDTPVGSVSAVREWSDWNAGYYWWIQSMFLSKSQRGKGRMSLLLDAVKHEMKVQKGLELRLYVHKDNCTAVRAYQNAHFSKSDYEIMILSN